MSRKNNKEEVNGTGIFVTVLAFMVILIVSIVIALLIANQIDAYPLLHIPLI